VYPFIDARPRPDRQLSVAESDEATAKANREAAAAALIEAKASGAPDADIAHIQYQVDEASQRVATAAAAVAQWKAEEIGSPTVGQCMRGIP